MAPNWIASQSATLPQASLLNITAKKYFCPTHCGPGAHAGVFHHLSLHRGRRYAAARTAHCLQSEFGKLCGRTSQYAASSLREMTFSLIAFKNQHCVSDILFGIQVKVWHCGTYLFLFKRKNVSRSKLCEVLRFVYNALWESFLRAYLELQRKLCWPMVSQGEKPGRMSCDKVVNIIILTLSYLSLF